MKKLKDGSVRKKFFSFFREIIKFIVIAILAIILFIVENIEFIAGLVMAAWTGYLMWNEYGRAMANFSFFVLFLLVVIATAKVNKNEN